MSDQTPAPDQQFGQDTQATDPAAQQQVTPEQPQIPEGYIPEDRYKEAQAWGTRASQEAAQYRQLIEGLQSDDPDTRANAAQALGIEFYDDTDTQPNDDPFVDQTARAELQALKAEREQEKQQALEAQRIAHLESVAEKDMASIGVPEHLKDWLVSRAVALPATDQGTLNIEAAWKEYQGIRDAEQQAWKSTKRAPFVSASGQQATQTPNLDNDAERQAWMAAQLADLDAAS